MVIRYGCFSFAISKFPRSFSFDMTDMADKICPRPTLQQVMETEILQLFGNKKEMPAKPENSECHRESCDHVEPAAHVLWEVGRTASRSCVCNVHNESTNFYVTQYAYCTHIL